MEINPLCVLDFYTYESCQRKGYGKIMFNEMLSREKIEPKKMGFDRPSEKFLNFLNKYYGLNDYVPQNNNYVVFKDYFNDVPVKRDKYDIYNNNTNTSGNNYNRNILSQRKLGKYSKGNDNENTNSKNKNNEISQKDKEFTSRIYKEYYNSNNENKKKENKENKEEEDNNNNYKYNPKKSFGYNQYQSTSSEYGAFFHMNK